MCADYIVIYFLLTTYVNGFPNETHTCNDGKYGVDCTYDCSPFCNQTTCTIQSQTGVPDCNKGCSGHHTGVFCQENCPSLCLECNKTTEACTKCVDGFYGTTCETRCRDICKFGTCEMDGSCTAVDYAERHPEKGLYQQGRCLAMNDTTKTCTCCKSKLRGENCELECENCQTYYNVKKCEYECKGGYYGYLCKNKCPVSCAPGNNGKPLCGIKEDGQLKCLNGCIKGQTGQQCDRGCNEACANGTCHQKDGKCISCEDGKYGDLCDSNCSHACLNANCKRNGLCFECKMGFYGDMCRGTCPKKCEQCRMQGGILHCQGCKHGHHGQICDQMCSTGCKDNKCDQEGHCTCVSGFYGKRCDRTCGGNCLDNLCNEHSETYRCTLGCEDGFVGRQCGERCPPDCNICREVTDGIQCRACREGYRLNDTGCQADVTSVVRGRSEWWISGVVVIVLLVIVIIISVVLFKCGLLPKSACTRGTDDATQRNGSPDESIPLASMAGGTDDATQRNGSPDESIPLASMAEPTNAGVQSHSDNVTVFEGSNLSINPEKTKPSETTDNILDVETMITRVDKAISFVSFRLFIEHKS